MCYTVVLLHKQRGKTLVLNCGSNDALIRGSISAGEAKPCWCHCTDCSDRGVWEMAESVEAKMPVIQ